MELELAGLQEHARIETLLPKAGHEQVRMLAGGNHDDAVAAPQARLQEQRDRGGEGLRVTVQLSEVPVDRSFDQQRTDKRRRHSAGLQRSRGFAHNAVT